MSNTNTGPAYPATPRGKMQKFIGGILADATEANADFAELETTVLDEIDKRVLGRVNGEIVYDDPDGSDAFIEPGDTPEPQGDGLSDWTDEDDKHFPRSNLNAMRLEQFAWLIDNAGEDRSPIRLDILWQWAEEMAYFQVQANRTGQAVEYVQRGKVLRVLHPAKAVA